MTTKCKICDREDPAGLVKHMWKSHGIHESQVTNVEQEPPKVEKKKAKKETKEEEPLVEEEVKEKGE